MAADDRLFSSVDWFRQLEAQRNGVVKAAESIPPEDFDRHSLDDLIEKIYNLGKLEIPEIDREGVTVSQREVDIDSSPGGYDPYGERRTRTVKGLSITVEVQFTGDKDLFKIEPNKQDFNKPRGEVRGNSITFSVVGTDFASNSPKPQIEDNLDRIERYLAWQREAIPAFDAEIRKLAAEQVTLRQQKVIAYKGVTSGLGYRVKP